MTLVKFPQLPPLLLRIFIKNLKDEMVKDFDSVVFFFKGNEITILSISLFKSKLYNLKTNTTKIVLSLLQIPQTIFMATATSPGRRQFTASTGDGSPHQLL